MKHKKILLSIVLIIIIIGALIQLKLFAASNTFYIGITDERTTSGTSYAIGNVGGGDSGKVIWEFLSYANSSDSESDNRDLYCVKGGVGFSDINSKYQYDEGYNVKSETSSIASLSSRSSNYSNIVNNNYKQILWITDNMYINGESTAEDKLALLKTAGINTNRSPYTVFPITDDDIDVVQQLALWYFTNPEASDAYHLSDLSSIHIKGDTDDEYTPMEDYNKFTNEGAYRLAQMQTLFNYFISSANSNSDKYNASNELEAPVTISTGNAKIKQSGTDFLIGPINISENNDLIYSLNFELTKENSEVIPASSIQFVNAAGTAIDVNSATEIYIKVPQTVGNTINVSITGEYKTSNTVLWVPAERANGAGNSDQPIIEVEKNAKDFSKELTVIFETTSISGTKTWVDYNNAENTRPNSITVRLMANGVAAKDGSNQDITKTVTSADNWEYEFTGLAKYDSSNNLITYTVEEDAVTGYTTTYTNNHLDITNTYRPYDLSLRKSITKINGESKNRLPQVDTSNLNKEGNTTAKYNHSKNLLESDTNQEIEYTITVYNEGEVAGYAGEIKDYLPAGIEYIGLVNESDSAKYTVNAEKDNTTGKTEITITNTEKKVLNAYNETTEEIDSVEFKIKCKVTAERGSTEKVLTNIAEISDYRDEDGNDMKENDRDSKPDSLTDENTTDSLPSDEDLPNYNGGQDTDTTDNYVPGQEDDDDFEKIVIPAAEGKYTIRLQKVSSTNTNTVLPGATFDVELADGTTKEVTSGTSYVTIAENVEITEAGTDIITITEEAAPGGYKKLLDEVTVTLTKTLSSGTYGISAVSLSNTTNASYDLNGNLISITIKDEPKEFDLSLRKFITKINEENVTTSREPNVIGEEVTKLGNKEATFDEGTTAKKEHSKTLLEVATGDKVIYTIRVYNEGEIAGKATEVTDYLPSGLKLSEGSTINETYGWESGANNSVTTNYLAGKTINELSATTINYEDIQIECEVTLTEGAIEQSLKNVAEITEATNDYGFEDRDSTPDNVEETGEDYEVETSPNGKGYEDDDDYEELLLPAAEGIYTIRLQKVSSTNTNTVLSGATFDVELADGTTKEVTSGTRYVTIAENIEITNEGTDTITITETTAPNGYKKLLETLRVNVTKALNSGVYSVTGVSLSNTTNASYDLNGNLISITIKDEPKEFDLSLRKFITAVSTNGDYSNTETTTTYTREPSISSTEVTALKNVEATFDEGKTAKKEHSKTPVEVRTGNKVLYTIRVYNEGEVDGKTTEITDYLPSGLKLAEGSTINETYGWEAGANNSVTTNYLAGKTIGALNGDTINYEDIQVECEVIATVGGSAQSLKNVAEITEATNDYGFEDRDSTPDNVEEKGSNYEVETSPNGKGYEDDDDYEELLLPAAENGKYSLVLIKEDENGEQLNSKAEFEVKVGENDAETKEVTGRLTIAENVEINAENVGTTDTYTIKETKAPDEYCEFEGTIEIRVNKKQEGTTYVIDKADYKVTDEEENEITTEDTKVYVRDGNIYVEVKNYEDRDYDLSLRKYITKVNGENIEISREPVIPTEETWKHDEGKTAQKNHTKNPLTVKTDDIVRYTIRVYNEGEIDGTAKEVTDFIPSGLEYIDNEFNRNQGWTMFDDEGNQTEDATNAKSIKTRKLEGETIKAFDSSKEISNTEELLNPDYRDIEVECKVIATKSEGYNLRNIAAITEDDGDDRDSKPEENPKNDDSYNPTDGGETGKGEQDDDDYDELNVEEIIENGKYSLVLIKEDENGEQLNSKAEFEVKVGENDAETKEVTGRLTIAENIEINAENVGTTDAYTIKETKAPDEYCEFEGTIEIRVSKKQEGTTYVIDKADYKVTDEEENEITTEDANVYVRDGNIYVEVINYEEKEFDLKLLKYVSKTIVTEDGNTTTTETHNTGNNSTDIIPKVEIHRKKLNSTTVKFAYTIRITNEGDIAGYAKEITDYVPEGLAFYTEDNTNWTVKSDGVIATRELENTLLQPGESADVQVTFRWINGANNLNLKRNTAEISEDYNEKGVPDRDSTPNNKKDGEDDIDIADVLLSIKTGAVKTYILLAGTVLIVLASGVIFVKKFAM